MKKMISFIEQFLYYTKHHLKSVKDFRADFVLNEYWSTARLSPCEDAVWSAVQNMPKWFLYFKWCLVLEVIDIYNSNQNFFESIWSVAKRKKITSEQFYAANYHCYNNTDKTVETILTEVIKGIEKKSIDRWFSYPDSKHFVWMSFNQEEHKYYRVVFDYSELQNELYLSGPNLLYTSLSFELTSDKTTVYSNSNLIDGCNTLHNNAYAITDINDKDIEIIYEKLVSTLAYHGYRYLVLTTSDAFEYDFIIYDIQTNEYAEKENGEYYLFEDEDSANKCCEELNITEVK